MRRTTIAAAIVSSLFISTAEAQPARPRFAGVLGGVSALSADARSEVTADRVDVSLYAPENGVALNILLGVRLHDYVAVQANYIWNRNDVALTSVHAAEQGPSVSEQSVASSQHAVVGDVLVYFRGPRSAVRPYLSAGVGIVRLAMRAARDRTGQAPTAPINSQTSGALLRVAVGVDLTLSAGWSARYSFSESLSANLISAQLSPPGQRSLANFQNLVGLVHAF